LAHKDGYTPLLVESEEGIEENLESVEGVQLGKGARGRDKNFVKQLGT
jgi:hypothetical protein